MLIIHYLRFSSYIVPFKLHMKKRTSSMLSFMIVENIASKNHRVDLRRFTVVFCMPFSL